ncbi:hypothetical protein [Mycobacterium sp.]|uniref:hypothetical protein n=1 Tax=Mycobacterium sp. TaxID=1785 RepID=UPI002CB72AFF|nr:hypothetical protein [Mycobacterium sp.]HTQ18536.1 hypothetical protein [Mycobacterium sp.]
MKLARPNTFHPRIVLAGWTQQVAGDGDDAGLIAALRHRGQHAHWMSWDDPEISRADLVILRATHDYADRLGEFLAWTIGVKNLLNPPGAVAWNADRRYLDELAGQGVPTVPGEVFAPGDKVRLPRDGHAFVSATIGSGAQRCTDRSAAAERAAELHEAGRSVLVQPCGSDPETVLVFLCGEPSHAFTKHSEGDGTLHQAEPDFEIWDVGAAALTTAAGQVTIDASELLYARAHVIGSPDDPRLLELQLVEPSLGWRALDAETRDLAQREFALGVESALERLGLGPFSHRSP